MNERLTPEHRAELRAIATETGTNTVTMTASELAAVLDALDTAERQLALSESRLDAALEELMLVRLDAASAGLVEDRPEPAPHRTHITIDGPLGPIEIVGP